MKINPEQLLYLAENLVDDLLKMHRDTAIDLHQWPNAMTLVSALRCADRGQMMNGHALCAREIEHPGYHTTMNEQEYQKYGLGQLDSDPVAR